MLPPLTTIPLYSAAFLFHCLLCSLILHSNTAVKCSNDDQFKNDFNHNVKEKLLKFSLNVNEKDKSIKTIETEKTELMKQVDTILDVDYRSYLPFNLYAINSQKKKSGCCKLYLQNLRLLMKHEKDLVDIVFKAIDKFNFDEEFNNIESNKEKFAKLILPNDKLEVLQNWEKRICPLSDIRELNQFEMEIIEDFRMFFQNLLNYLFGTIKQFRQSEYIVNYNLELEGNIEKQIRQPIGDLKNFLYTEEYDGCNEKIMNKIIETQELVFNNLEVIQAKFKQPNRYKQELELYSKLTNNYTGPFKKMQIHFLLVQIKCLTLVKQWMKSFKSICIDIGSSISLFNGLIKQIDTHRKQLEQYLPRKLQNTLVKQFGFYQPKFELIDDLNNIYQFQLSSIAMIKNIVNNYFNYLHKFESIEENKIPSNIRPEYKLQTNNDKEKAANNNIQDDSKLNLNKSNDLLLQEELKPKRPAQRKNISFWNKSTEIIGIGSFITILIAAGGLYLFRKDIFYGIGTILNYGNDQSQLNNNPSLLGEVTTTWTSPIGINSILIIFVLVLALVSVLLFFFLVRKSNNNSTKVQSKVIQQIATTKNIINKKQDCLLKTLVDSNTQMMKTLTAMERRQQPTPRHQPTPRQQRQRQRQTAPGKNQQKYPRFQKIIPPQSNMSGYLFLDASSAGASSTFPPNPSTAATLIESKILIPTDNPIKVTSEGSKKTGPQIEKSKETLT